MPTSVDIKNLKINKLTEAQYDTAVQGGVIGENELSVLTDAELEQIQVSALPTASADELGKIYQYIGATDSTYTNAYFYKCVSDGQTPATYSWEAVEVQASSGGLPSQTGQSGKFLTTNGTDASWGNALQNTATGTDAITICGTASAFENSINIGVGSKAKRECVIIGHNAQTGNYTGTYGVAVGSDTKISTNVGYEVALGNRAQCAASHANQIGSTGNVTTNSDANTFKFANSNGNYEIMSADGTIPKERLVNAISKPSTMPELTVAGWSNNTQTVTVTGVTATNTVFVSPAPSSAADYAAAGIVCTAQAADSLTFTCTTVPANAITVNVVIF